MTDTLTWDWTVEADQDEILTVPQLRDGDPFDVRGWTVAATVHRRPGDAPTYTFPSSAVELVAVDMADPARDGIRLTLPVLVITGIRAVLHTGWWKMTIISPAPDNLADRVVQGLFLINP